MNTQRPNHELFEQMARVIWSGDVRDMLIDGQPYEQIEARIVTDLRRYGISSEMACFMAPSALQCLRRTMAEQHGFPSGGLTRYLHQSRKRDRNLLRSCLEQDEILFCVEQAERRPPLLKRLLPSSNESTRRSRQPVLIGVTNRRVISVLLNAPDNECKLRRVELFLPLQELQCVRCEPSADGRQLQLITNTGSPRTYDNLLPSAANRLVTDIEVSRQHLLRTLPTRR